MVTIISWFMPVQMPMDSVVIAGHKIVVRKRTKATARVCDHHAHKGILQKVDIGTLAPDSNPTQHQRRRFLAVDFEAKSSADLDQVGVVSLSKEMGVVITVALDPEAV